MYILNQKDRRSKFEKKVDEGFFLGYGNEPKAYKVFEVNSQIVEENSHVMFDDDTYKNDLVDHPASILYELTHYPSKDYDLIEFVISFKANLPLSPYSSLKGVILIK